jgi:hypothetical protein
MDMASDLRANMARHGVSVAEVAALVGRTTTHVTRYRTGDSPIPLDVARVLNQHTPQLLSDAAILGKDAA